MALSSVSPAAPATAASVLAQRNRNAQQALRSKSSASAVLVTCHLRQDKTSQVKSSQVKSSQVYSIIRALIMTAADPMSTLKSTSRSTSYQLYQYTVYIENIRKMSTVKSGGKPESKKRLFHTPGALKAFFVPFPPANFLGFIGQYSGRHL